eukprot:PITA_27445
MYAEGTDFFERIAGSDLIAMAEESEARPGQSGASEIPSKERPGQSGMREILSMSVDQEDLSEDINIEKEMRNLEAIVALLVLTMLGSFIGELAYAKPKPTEVLKGMFVPNLSGHGAVAIAISLIGALLTPYNLFLHSALVLSRKVPRTVEGINSVCRYFLVETGVALFIAFLINVAVTSVSGAICSSPNLSPEDSDNCNNLDLNRASFLLNHVLGKTSSTVYAVALLAAGQSASITGTYAGQYIMLGFLNMKMKVWLRNFLSRSVAIVPSLIVSVIYGSSGAGKLIIISSLLVVAWIIGWCIIAVNIYYLSSGFATWLVHNSLPKIASIFIGIVVFPLMALYAVSILYLTFRPDKKVTYKVTYIAPAELAV